MAAPSGTVWGSVVGSYGKIGLYVSKSSTNTETTVTVEIWFASKYSVSDSANTLYYDIGYAKDGGATTSKGSVSVSTSVASGSGWSTSNQIKLKTYTATYTRANSTATKYIYAKLADVDRVGGTMYVSTTTTIPGLTSYAVKYNANGGSGAPSAQTKYYGKNITLSSSKPTRTGYTFQKWNTNSSGTGTSYSPGAVYSGNAALTLYAIWKANTYTIDFNANGGSLGSVSSTKTKTYGVTMTLPTAAPTRTNYTFLGWSTSKTATSATYSAGGSFTTNANTTLYAVWSLAYTPPRVKITQIYRGTWSSTENAFTASDDGKHCQFTVSVSTDKTITGMTTTVYDSSGTVFGNIITWSDFTDFTKTIDGREFDPEKTYKIEFTVTDEGGSSTAIAYLPSTKYIIDIRKGGTGIAFGKTSTTSNLTSSAWTLGVGAKEKYGDSNTGVLIHKEGYIHLQRNSTNGKPYIGFLVDDDHSDETGALTTRANIRYNKETDRLEFIDAGGYEFNNRIYAQNSIELPAGKGIYAPYPKSGVVRELFKTNASTGTLYIGQGNCSDDLGDTILMGNNVGIYSQVAGGVSYIPYYKKGDSISISIATAGYVTSSSKEVSFMVPLSKPIIGNPTATAASINGLCLRQNGSYTHGSSASATVSPSSYSASIKPGGIYVVAKFTDTTNVTNNDSIGINWSGTITLS